MRATGQETEYLIYERRGRMETIEMQIRMNVGNDERSERSMNGRS